MPRTAGRIADELHELLERAAVPTPRLLVGPEGCFSDEEALACREAGVPAASLGACALRTELAAVAAAAVVLTGA